MRASRERPRIASEIARGATDPIPTADRPILSCSFDCYGTLIDWREGIERSLGGTLRELGYSGTESVFAAYFEAERAEEENYAPYRDVLASTATRVGAKFGVKLPDSRARAFAESLPTWPAFPDTAPVLRELGRRGVRRYILSNVDRDLLKETIRRNSFEVDGVVTAEDVTSYKPAYAHWNRLFRHHSVDPATHLHVAQSLFIDIVPARDLGLRTAWINRYAERMPASVRPTYILSDLRGLPALVSHRRFPSASSRLRQRRLSRRSR